MRALLAAPSIRVNQATTDDGTTALALASANGHVACVVALLGCKDIDPNKPQMDADTGVPGATPLCLASQQGHVECVRALLAMRGIRVNHSTTTTGSTALILVRQS